MVFPTLFDQCILHVEAMLDGKLVFTEVIQSHTVTLAWEIVANLQVGFQQSQYTLTVWCGLPENIATKTENMTVTYMLVPRLPPVIN